jgi:hypothetical protein
VDLLRSLTIVISDGREEVEAPLDVGIVVGEEIDRYALACKG